MSKNTNVDPDKIHLLDVKIVKGNIDAGSDLVEDRLHSLGIHFDIKDSFQLKEKLARFLFTTKFNGLDKKDKPLPLSAEFSFDFVFKVDNLEDYITNLDQKNNTVDVSSTLGHMLIAIVYSTARGIILTRTQGTIIKNGILLPVINTQRLLQKPAVEETDNQLAPKKPKRDAKFKNR